MEFKTIDFNTYEKRYKRGLVLTKFHFPYSIDDELPRTPKYKKGRDFFNFIFNKSELLALPVLSRFFSEVNTEEREYSENGDHWVYYKPSKSSLLFGIAINLVYMLIQAIDNYDNVVALKDKELSELKHRNLQELDSVRIDHIKEVSDLKAFYEKKLLDAQKDFDDSLSKIENSYSKLISDLSVKNADSFNEALSQCKSDCKQDYEKELSYVLKNKEYVINVLEQLRSEKDKIIKNQRHYISLLERKINLLDNGLCKYTDAVALEHEIADFRKDLNLD